IKVAIAFGDLSENAEYDAAKNEQAQVEERIMKLENMIRKAVIIDESQIDVNVVTIGSIVKVNDVEFDEEVEYTIVGSAEADPYDGKISNESPVGKALLGRTVGDEVDVQVPDGTAKFKILEIRR
ncbi:MAG: transcription elongation factor GreA, partial [Peptostreptococcaceae bacterium]|nr:transcription elongation factor GreA [Peptostreptococcaceae bacterium]